MSYQFSSLFWDKYIEKTLTYNIKPASAKWYVRHAENYIEYHKNKRINHHSAADVDRYLKDKSGSPRLLDWQYMQLITALKILLLEMLHLPWTKSFPWDSYQEMAASLPDSHPTVARDYQDSQTPSSSAATSETGDNYSHSQRIVFKKYPDKWRVWFGRFVLYNIRSEPSRLMWPGWCIFLISLVKKTGFIK